VFRAALRLARPAAFLAVAVMAAACVGGAGAAGPSSPTSPTSPTPSPTTEHPDTVIFRVSWEGGFVTPEMLLGRLPVVAVYADGRTITLGPVPAIFPGPFMPNVLEQTLSREALDSLIQLARDKDLLKDVRYDFPGIADAADTVLEINLDGQSYRLSAYALAEAADGGVAPAIEVPPADVAGRAAMREFIDALTAMPADSFVDQQHPYAFDALRLYVTKAAIVENSEFPGEQPPIAWPLDDLAAAGEPVENSPVGARCLVVEGDDLATIKPLLDGANQLSVFESEGEFYSLIPRPLYPDESGC
jgi:hypothetical protein